MKLFIPTRGRIRRQLTLSYLHFLDPIMVVPECEASEWLYAARMRTVPDEFRFSDVRQWILENEGDDDEPCVVVDDDLYFYRRKMKDNIRLSKAEPDDIRCMMSWIRYAAAEYAHGGISAREGNNHVEEFSKTVGRVMRFHFYKPGPLRHLRFDFRDIAARQDFHCTLSLLRAGYPNIISYEFAHNQRGSQDEGGCSRYRIPEMLRETAYRLKELHPDFVTPYQKWTEGAWGGGYRWDVRIQWQKAFESADTIQRNG